LFERTIQEIEGSEDTEVEWENLKKINEKETVLKKRFKEMDEHLAKVINDKREAYKKGLSAGSIEDEIEYKRCRAVAKREVRKNKREMWNTFVSRLENDVSKPRSKTYKIIRMLKNYTREQVKINPIKKES
jgi:hypothetical protein